MPNAKKKQPSKQSSGTYHLTFKMGDLLYTADSDSLLDAIEQIQPPLVKYSAIVTLVAGDLHAETRLPPIFIRRMLVNKITRQILGKRLSMALR